MLSKDLKGLYDAYKNVHPGEQVQEAVYGGEPKKPEEPKDTRMVVTKADQTANTPAYRAFKAGDKRYKAAGHLGEDMDTWDLVLEFLVAEGYADTNEDALAIMTELDQEIIQGIVEDSATLSAAARKRAEELGRKRRSTKAYKQGLNRGTGRNERAAYNLSNIQRTPAANPSTQVSRSRKPAGHDTGGHKGDYKRFERSKPENNPKHNANK